MHDKIVNGRSDPFCSENRFDELKRTSKTFHGVLGSSSGKMSANQIFCYENYIENYPFQRQKLFGESFSPSSSVPKTDISMKANIAKISSHFQLVHRGKLFSVFRFSPILKLCGGGKKAKKVSL
jgi:hypothetical protein